MRWSRTLCIGLLILAALTAGGLRIVRGQAAGPTATQQATGEPVVDALIADLGSEQWSRRQSAQRELAELGPQVRQRLLNLVHQTDNEAVRSGAEVVLAQIAEEVGNGVTLITMQFKGASPRQAFAELARQSRARISPSPATLWLEQTTPLLDVDADNQPFWLVLRQLCLKTGLTVQDRSGMFITRPDTDQRQIIGKAPFVVNGPFMIVVSGVRQTRFLNLDRPANKPTGSCSLEMIVCVEPKIRVLQSQGRPTVESAIDENGRSLVAGQASELTGSGNIAGHWTYHQRIELSRPPGSGARLALIKGTSRFSLQTRSSPPQTRVVDVGFEFRDIPLP